MDAGSATLTSNSENTTTSKYPAEAHFFEQRKKMFLLRCLRSCCILLWDGLRLFLYALVLAPAFGRFAWYYWVSSDRLVVRYDNKSCRQYMDVYRPHDYTPPEEESRGCFCRRRRAGDALTSLPEGRPVVFFCCGGAWIIGYKMWGALLARVLMAAGLTVVVPDYRNYPWGTVPQAIDDVETALQWTLDHMNGPDEEATTETEMASSCNYQSQLTPLTNLNRKKIVVVGQSAGAHLLTTLFLRKAVEQMRGERAADSSTSNLASSFSTADVSGLISLSGPCNLGSMQSTFQRHGLDSHIVDRIFGGQKDEYDPFVILERATQNNDTVVSNHRQTPLRDCLPPIKIYHGSRDKTVPAQVSIDFCTQLQQAHNIENVTYHSYDGWSHTDPILEGPMDADHRFHRDIFDSVVEWTQSANNDDRVVWPGEGQEATAPVMKKLCPHFLIQLGRCFMPF